MDRHATALPVWVHAVDLEGVSGCSEAELRSLLGDGELARLERFRPLDMKRQFLVAHALLRMALSAHTGVPPTQWRFGTTATGKPFIEGPANAETPAFSLSHTRGLAVCAVANCPALGIDAERHDREARVEDLLPRIFSPQERAQLHGLSGPELHRAFFRGWTLKEALLKAHGTGLRTDPRTVGFDRSTPTFLHLPEDLQADTWQCGILNLGPDHSGAWAARSEQRLEPKVRWGMPGQDRP